MLKPHQKTFDSQGKKTKKAVCIPHLKKGKVKVRKFKQAAAGKGVL